MSEITECYEVLGCRYGESIKNIKKKFIELSLIHHPDKGGEKEFFDVICSAYKTIRRIRRDERFPDDDIKYLIGDDYENVREFTEDEFNSMVVEAEANLSPGYNEFSSGVLFDIDLSKEFLYDPNDIVVGNFDENCCGGKNEHRDPNNLSPNINYTGRDTDSSQYYGLVEYGKFDNATQGKTSLQGHDLGNVFCGISLDPPPRLEHVDSGKLDMDLERLIEDRENFSVEYPKFCKSFEEINNRYLVDCAVEANINRMKSMMRLK